MCHSDFGTVGPRRLPRGAGQAWGEGGDGLRVWSPPWDIFSVRSLSALSLVVLLFL